MSNNIQERLVNCFKTVFPNLTRDEILSADYNTVPAWDSLALVTLVFILEEEFGVAIEADEFQQMTSFDSVLQFLEGKAVNA